jgi:hypothetical protein
LVSFQGHEINAVALTFDIRGREVNGRSYLPRRAAGIGDETIGFSIAYERSKSGTALCWFCFPLYRLWKLERVQALSF